MMFYLCFLLDEDFVEEISKIFPFKFSVKPEHHITYQLKTKPSAFLPLTDDFKIIGYTSDDSLECLIVTLDDSTKRYDGEDYHITWSREENRQSKESNDVLKKGFHKINPITVRGSWKFKLMK